MITPEQRAKYRRILDAMSKRGAAVPSEFALKLLDALDASEVRLAGAYEGIGLDPEIEYTPEQIHGEAYGTRMALEYAERRIVELSAHIHQIQSEHASSALDNHAALEKSNNRVAELENAIRSVFEADHPINEMHAERALRNLVYKDGCV